LFNDPQGSFREIAEFAGLSGDIASTGGAKNEFNPKGSQRYPLGELWRAYRRHPEVLELSAYLGYTLDDIDLEKRLKRYQPPDSALYRLLYAVRWYHIRGYVGHRLRPRFWRDHRRARQGEDLLVRATSFQ
jgi:hypothetical protein